MDEESNNTEIETIVAEEEIQNDEPDSGFETCSEKSDSSDQTLINSSLESLVENLELNKAENENEAEEIAEIQLDHALENNVELIVDRDNENFILINKDKTATINDVLNQASLMGDFAMEDFDLSMDGRLLPRTVTLRDAGIIRGNRLRLVERTFQIFIRQVDGRTITMDVRNSTTIQAVKERYDYDFHVPVHQQRLLFQSKELENTRTLQFYKIRSSSTLEMVYRLRGGA